MEVVDFAPSGVEERLKTNIFALFAFASSSLRFCAISRAPWAFSSRVELAPAAFCPELLVAALDLGVAAGALAAALAALDVGTFTSSRRRSGVDARETGLDIAFLAVPMELTERVLTDRESASSGGQLLTRRRPELRRRTVLRSGPRGTVSCGFHLSTGCCRL